MINEYVQRATEFLRRRSLAYRRVLDKENLDAKVVLEDLAKFCRANETTFHPDPRLHAVMEGRREVWLRITNHLNLSTEELFALYGEKTKR